MDWNSLAGQVAGNYVLGNLAGEFHGSGVFDLAAGAGGARSTMHLLPLDDTNAAAQSQSWKLASGLEHPNLLRVSDSGEVTVNGRNYVYAVTERPDDTVASALAKRALTGDEVRTILAAIVPALAYLHERNFMHGGLDPSSIVAVGETVKLATPRLRPGDPHGFARDIRGLGKSVEEMLRPSSSITAVAGKRSAPLPSPFREIVAGATEGDSTSQWTLNEVRRSLAGEKIQQATTPRIESKAGLSSQGLPAVSADPPPFRPVRARGENSSRPAWLMPVAGLGLAAVVVTVGIMALRSPSTGESKPPVQTAMRPDPITAVPPPVTAGKKSPLTAAPVTTARAQSGTAARANAGQWGVVAAIYKDHDLALKRARKLREHWTRTKIEVLPPKGEGKLYMVTLGYGLQRADAERLRDRARAAGLPRDTYVTKMDIKNP